VLALLYGGRSPLWFVCTLVLAAVAVRVIKHRSFLPRESLGRVLVAAFVIGALAYNVYVIRQRTELSGMREYEDYVAQMGFYGAEPSPLADGMRQWLDQDALVPALSTAFYFTHGFSILEKTLSYDTLGPYLGRYQFALVSIVVGRLVPSMAPDDDMDDEMDAAGAYGVFSTMWGGMYLDFGSVGALGVLFVFGWLGGMAHKRAMQTDSLAAQLVECYSLAAIATSPVVSVFLPYISLPALASLLIGAGAVSLAAARTRDVVPAASADGVARLSVPSQARALPPAAPRPS
jgi:hypothetical protein